MSLEDCRVTCPQMESQFSVQKLKVFQKLENVTESFVINCQSDHTKLVAEFYSFSKYCRLTGPNWVVLLIHMMLDGTEVTWGFNSVGKPKLAFIYLSGDNRKTGLSRIPRPASLSLCLTLSHLRSLPLHLNFPTV